MLRSRTRKVKPETPGSRIYWNAYVRWEEYCKEATYKYVIKKKPFFQFIIDEIDLALREYQASGAQPSISSKADIHHQFQGIAESSLSTPPKPDNT